MWREYGRELLNIVSHAEVKASNRSCKRGPYMFFHVSWDVRDIKVGVALIRKLLQLGIERFLHDVITNVTNRFLEG